MKRFKQVFMGFFVVVMMVSGWNNAFAAAATVDTSEVHQTIEGFGASVAWWATNLYSHSKKGEIYNYLFKELGLDILRLRNIYKHGEDDGFAVYGEIVDSFYSLSENEPKVLICSWSPPVDLKSNGNLVGGTLDTNTSGEYVYGDFAEYWIDALDSFATVGIVPDYISIQNEPDWDESHETCRLEPTENGTSAGYDQALDSVYQRFQGLASPPMILAPEVLGIGYNNFQNYSNRFNHDHADGYAYHLYHGGSGNVDPDVFNTNLEAIANGYPGKPIFQTEYDIGGWFNTAWLMHNCLVHGNVSGYLYWTLVWGGIDETFIELSGSQYSIKQIYWVFRQYSKAIHHGWKRVGASVDADSLRISAFIDPAGSELSAVIINVSHSADFVDIDFGDFDMAGANILRTSEGEKCDYIGDYNGSAVNLPARSITTISTLYIEDVSGIEEENYDSPVAVSLSQNYPNPFSTSTTIEYSMTDAGFVKLSIYDVSGREVKILVEEVKSAGKYSVSFKGDDLSQGVYFYRLETAKNKIQRKMILLK